MQKLRKHASSHRCEYRKYRDTRRSTRDNAAPLHRRLRSGRSLSEVAYIPFRNSITGDSTNERDGLHLLLFKVNRTALHRACYQGHDECVQILIYHGASLAAITKTGVTAIDAVFGHIPQPLVFLTDILDSCVRTNNNSCSQGRYDVRMISLYARLVVPSRSDISRRVIAVTLSPDLGSS